MPSFNEIFEVQKKMRVGQPCATGLWRAALTQADRDQFDAALADVGVPTSSIHRTMKAMGYEFGESAVKRHRAGGCKCSLTN